MCAAFAHSEQAQKRRWSLHKFLVQKCGLEYDQNVGHYDIVPTSKQEAEWSKRIGEVLIAAFLCGDTLLIILDYQYFDTRDSHWEARHRDIVKGCFIEAMSNHGPALQGCDDDGVVCLAFPAESRQIFDEILPSCRGLSLPARRLTWRVMRTK